MAGGTDANGTNVGCHMPDTAIVHPHAALLSTNPKAALPTAHPNNPVPEVTGKPIQRFLDLNARWAM